MFYNLSGFSGFWQAFVSVVSDVDINLDHENSGIFLYCFENDIICTCVPLKLGIMYCLKLFLFG